VHHNKPRNYFQQCQINQFAFRTVKFDPTFAPNGTQTNTAIPSL